MILRVGLTGGLASGKSAVSLVFAEGGAHVLYADELGRALMQPGQPVYARIVEQFGPRVVTAGGELDRHALAEQAFARGRLQELNAIVHPAVLTAQQAAIESLSQQDPAGIVVVESALIFEVSLDEPAREDAKTPGKPPTHPWRTRFDRLVLVTAPEELKVARYVERTASPGADASMRQALAADAQRRLAAQIPDPEKAPLCDYVIENTQTLVLLRRKAQAVLRELQAVAAARLRPYA